MSQILSPPQRRPDLIGQCESCKTIAIFGEEEQMVDEEFVPVEPRIERSFGDKPDLVIPLPPKKVIVTTAACQTEWCRTRGKRVKLHTLPGRMGHAGGEVMKVVYSPNIGGLDVSVEQVRRGRIASGNPLWGGACLLGDRDPRWPDEALDYESTACVGYDVERWDPVLVVLAEEPDSGMTVIDIPAGTRFRIRENEETGQEWIEYPDDIKWQVAK